MKIKFLLFCCCLFFTIGSLHAQCPKGSVNGGYNASSLTLGNRTQIGCCVWGGEYMSVTNLTPGNTYLFDDCGVTDDTEITLFTGGTSTAVGFDGSSCGDDGEISYTVPGGVTSLDIQVNTNSCGTNATNHAVFITLTALLPVELVRFFATLKESFVELSWETASESNNEGFEVQRSLDTRNWEVLDFVSGQGNAYEKTSYQFIDKDPYPGINYYRLNQIDYDGKETLSEVINMTINEGLDAFKLSIVPNPVQEGSFTIYYPEVKNSTTNLMLFDVSGRLYRQETLSGTASSVDVSDLQPGIYLVKVMTQNKVAIEKIVVK